MSSISFSVAVAVAAPAGDGGHRGVARGNPAIYPGDHPHARQNVIISPASAARCAPHRRRATERVFIHTLLGVQLVGISHVGQPSYCGAKMTRQREMTDVHYVSLVAINKLFIGRAATASVLIGDYRLVKVKPATSDEEIMNVLNERTHALGTWGLLHELQFVLDNLHKKFHHNFSNKLCTL
jgi:hypothetical protein